MQLSISQGVMSAADGLPWTQEAEGSSPSTLTRMCYIIEYEIGFHI